LVVNRANIRLRLVDPHAALHDCDMVAALREPSVAPAAAIVRVVAHALIGDLSVFTKTHAHIVTPIRPLADKATAMVLLLAAGSRRDPGHLADLLPPLALPEHMVGDTLVTKDIGDGSMLTYNAHDQHQLLRQGIASSADVVPNATALAYKVAGNRFIADNDWRRALAAFSMALSLDASDGGAQDGRRRALQMLGHGDEGGASTNESFTRVLNGWRVFEQQWHRASRNRARCARDRQCARRRARAA
jgi:hypothetical protein